MHLAWEKKYKNVKKINNSWRKEIYVVTKNKSLQVFSCFTMDATKMYLKRFKYQQKAI